MNKAVTIDASHPQPHLQAYAAMRERDKAREELEKFKALNKERVAQRDKQTEREFTSK